jgi:hypothetical protein
MTENYIARVKLGVINMNYEIKVIDLHDNF